MVIIAYHAMKSNFAAEMPLIEDLRYFPNYANLEFVTTARTWGCLSSDAYDFLIPFYFRIIGPKVAV